MLSQPWIERGGANKQARGIETRWGRRCRVVVGVPHKSLLDGCGRRARGGRTRSCWCGWVTSVFTHSLTELRQLASELGKLMLGIRISCTGRNPAVDEICNLLRGILGVVGFVQQFPILPGPTVGDFVQVDAFVSELRQESCHEYNCCDVPCRDQVKFTTMSQLAKPKVIGLLIQQGCHRQLQRITPLNVQLLCKCRLANAAWEGQCR